MKYPNVISAIFIQRVNRFIAHCRLPVTNEVLIVHVKNTGRGKEILLPGATVALQYVPSPTRKTSYDLIAVKKGEDWFNIDSQLPNRLAFDGIQDQQIELPGLEGELTSLRREVKFEHSKFDLLAQTSTGRQAFIEVKGLTLENQQIGAFPDAPTVRGLKHVHELIDAKQQGFQAYVLFIIQFEHIKLATVHTQMQPALRDELALALQAGVQILAYNCHVTADEVQLKEEIPFQLDYPFIDPIKP